MLEQGRGHAHKVYDDEVSHGPMMLASRVMLGRILDVFRGQPMVVTGTSKLKEGEAKRIDVGDPLGDGFQFLLCRVEGEVYSGSHIPPPEELGCGGAWLPELDRLIELLSADQAVGLTPQGDVTARWIHPAVPDGSVLLRGESCEEARLNTAGHSGQDRAHGSARAALRYAA